MNLFKYVYAYDFKPKKSIIDYDLDFWEDIEDYDLEEAVEEYVRDCSDFYESID